MAVISEKGAQLLAQWEGNILHVYKDAVGKDTIGVGHLLTRQELASGVIQIGDEAVAYKDGITEQQSLDLLAQDLDGYNDAVNQVLVELTQDQF
jgi:GH24 family phage-related lysozyme (muramidase)